MSAQVLKISLRNALQNYRQHRPNLSLRAIAKNSGVNRYFLTKLMDEADDAQSLDLNQVIILSKFITQKDSVKEVIEASSQEVQQALHKIFNVAFVSQKALAKGIERVNLYDHDIYFTLVLASFARGTKREYVQRILGEKGEKALSLLLKEDIVDEQDGRIRLKEGNEFTLSTDILKQRIPDYLRHYSYDRNCQRKNHIQVYSEGLTRSAIDRIYDAHVKMNRTIQDILSDSMSHGDIPFFSFAVMDQFIETPE